MNIVVLSWDDAEKFESSSPWAAISVVSCGDFPKLSENNRVGLLQLAFWDYEESVGSYDPRMTKEQAEEILEFADEMWEKIGCLLVHCEQGKSRSPAIAAALSRIKIGHDGGYFRTHTPNTWVYDSLLRMNETRRRQ